MSQIQSFTPALVLTLGLAIGLQHAFEPDHIAAVTTQISRQKNKSQSLKDMIKEGSLKSSVMGALWGAGHTTTLVLVGLSVYVLSIKIPDVFFVSSEFIVGTMLIFLALMTLSNRKIFKIKHMHVHAHEDGTVHTHPHEHNNDHKHGHKSYLIGCIHGLAGSGALLVLVAGTLSNIQDMLSFILIFGIGSIIGMALVSSLIGIPFALSHKAVSLEKTLRYIVSSVSFLIGISIVYEMVFIEKLFSF
ncbi:MAG TPA: high frequency lysogenization protein HflD [Nitrosopumilaceae archaeon]|nr:high frequency lysogenization protein HflD [Nitrosopumilaceae archaeon]